MSAIMPNITPPEDDLAPIVKAVKQLLAVKPQLLFDACKKVGAEYLLDTIKADLEGKPKLKQSLILRGAILQVICSLLIRTGNASLSDDDMSSLVYVMQMNAEYDKRNGGK
jgi:hypothetical protein